MSNYCVEFMSYEKIKKEKDISMCYYICFLLLIFPKKCLSFSNFSVYYLATFYCILCLFITSLGYIYKKAIFYYKANKFLYFLTQKLIIFFTKNNCKFSVVLLLIQHCEKGLNQICMKIPMYECIYRQEMSHKKYFLGSSDENSIQFSSNIFKKQTYSSPESVNNQFSKKKLSIFF